MIDIKSINSLLELNLTIPDYQRPYKWKENNIFDLLSDINNVITETINNKDLKYRIGTIILYTGNKEKEFSIVDGQQRIISLILIKLFLEEHFKCTLLDFPFEDKISQFHIHNNYEFINDWFALKDDDYKKKI